MNVSFLNMNDECGCLLSFHAHFWYWPLLFHVRESWLPQRGVRRAYHRLFLYKCLSPYICLCLSIVVYLLQDRYGGKYIYIEQDKYLSCSIYIFTSISGLQQGLGTSWQIIRDPWNQSKYLSKNQPKLSFLQNFEIWFWKTFNLPFNLSPSQFELLVSLNYCTFHSFLPFSVPGAKSLFLVPRPYVIICLQPVP